MSGPRIRQAHQYLSAILEHASAERIGEYPATRVELPRQSEPEPLWYASARRVWEAARERAGLDGVTPHDLRPHVRIAYAVGGRRLVEIQQTRAPVPPS